MSHQPAIRRFSRNNVDQTERFRELANAIAAPKAPTVVLDGEVCVYRGGPTRSWIKVKIQREG